MLCIPIQADTTAETIIKMHKAAPDADIIEIWLDQITDLHLFKIIKDKPKPLLFVNKSARERGKFSGSEQSRVGLLKQAIELGADYIDIGVDTNEALIEDLLKINRDRAKIIISYHNFISTPEEKELFDVAKKAYKLKADIVKIATTAVNYQDNLKVFSTVDYFVSQKKNIIGLCMGDRGKISRVVAPLIGSYLTYAALSEKETSAPGQLTVGELKGIWEKLK